MFDLKKMTSFVAGPAGVLVILFFFLPWVSVSCNAGESLGISDETLLKGSGYDLATGFDEDNLEIGPEDSGLGDFGDFESTGDGTSFSEGNFALVEGEKSELDADALMYLIPVVGFLGLVLAALGFLEPRLLNPITGFVFYIGPAIAGLVVMVLKYMDLADEIDLANEQALTEAINGGAEGLPGGFAFTGDFFKLNFEIGWWLTILGLLVILATGIVVFLYQERKETVFAAEGGPQPAMPPPQPAAQTTYTSSYISQQQETQQLLAAARDHIRARRFSEARTVLQMLDHPKAREWLAKIDQIEKQE